MTASLSSMAGILCGHKEDSEARCDLSIMDFFDGVAVARSAVAAEIQYNSLLSRCSAPTNHLLLDLYYPLTFVFVNDFIDPGLHLVLPHITIFSVVCMLEKVKLALERVEHESRRSAERFPSLSSLTTISSGKRHVIMEEGAESLSVVTGKEMILAGCRQCLVYVLVRKSESMCPQCNSNMRVPATVKKSHIDLNLSSTE